MAGHSKWSKVRRCKGALDIQRGQLFRKLSQETIVPATCGGSNPAAQPSSQAVALSQDYFSPGTEPFVEEVEQKDDARNAQTNLELSDEPSAKLAA